ncbi:MAG: bifunctional folylpolyglutamate synthase/dihydrofolate synthase [Planctomycetes bacterium]|nr:bifunctional folylpolyglutamate synthase/dihydrofolate synthase [Planctomycetota bacterium]
MRVGLAPMVDLMERLGSPHQSFRAVHVTGTKGKGTTAALVSEVLARAGLRTGLYTSPHVERVNERVRIDGREVADDDLAAALEDALAARAAAIHAGTAADEATWFDLVTAAAFLVFQRARCDWAVVEVGIGGRLDSTNVVRGEVAVVTNVDLEHVAVLGATRAAIAREKGGIVKRGSVLVTGVHPDPGARPEDDAAGVLASIAEGQGAALVRPAQVAADLAERNADLARLALDALGQRGLRGARGETISGALLDAAAVDAARLPGRQELRSARGVPVLLDGAHVASSLERVLAEAARDRRLPPRQPVVVLALGRDKDAGAVLKVLAGSVDRLVCTTAASGPLRAAETMAEEATRAGIGAETAPDPAAALAQALQLAADGGWVLVTGSFHLAGATRPLLDAPRKAP